MTGRRSFLRSVLGLLLAMPAARLVAAPIPMGAEIGPRIGAAGGLVARRHGAYFLVDGWVLTAQDLKTLDVKVVS